MTDITEFESAVLRKIAYHYMGTLNGQRPTCADEASTFCWAEDFAAINMSIAQTKGVLSSLVKKGLVVIDPYDERDNTVSFTEIGYQVFNEQVDPQ